MRTLVWFRKSLRLHDNPLLMSAAAASSSIVPIFVMDPWHSKETNLGKVRYTFLMESLDALDESLRSAGVSCGLSFVQGEPSVLLPKLCAAWKISAIAVDDEDELEPHDRNMVATVLERVQATGIKVLRPHSHLLHDMDDYAKALDGASPPMTMISFTKLFSKLGNVAQPLEAPQNLPHTASDTSAALAAKADLPSLAIVDVRDRLAQSQIKFPGGEAAALKRLSDMVTNRPAWTAQFEKPKTAPNALEPATTVLSPYLTHGCLSARRFYHTVAAVYTDNPKHSKVPESLHGQLLFREMWYVIGRFAGHGADLSRMEGNPICRQIPWDSDEDMLKAWEEGRTGFPFIDAIMKQLKQEGWIHHLARHAVACFLTRGDLWQSWEQGFRVFDRLLIDADWTINACNWYWLSCSAFFYQYFRCYSPVAFGKKTDPEGAYIRKYVPQLANMPAKYIYEPWKAPLEVQRRAGCVIGQDYPSPIVDHAVASKANMARMKAAYAEHKRKATNDSVVGANSSAGAGTGAKKRKTNKSK
jgi:cryptochrome